MDHYQRSGGDLMASTISVDSVIGRAFLLFWPPSRATWLSVPDTFDVVPEPGSVASTGQPIEPVPADPPGALSAAPSG